MPAPLGDPHLFRVDSTGIVGVPPVQRWHSAQIRALREALRLSVRGFSAHLGVSHRIVSRWEAGAKPRPASQSLLDSALRLATVEQRHRFATLATSITPPAAVPVSDDGAGWTIHLHAQVADQDSAIEVAQAICAQIREQLPCLTAGLTTVSPADQNSHQQRVFCDRRLPDRISRCEHPPQHPGPCANANVSPDRSRSRSPSR